MKNQFIATTIVSCALLSNSIDAGFAMQHPSMPAGMSHEEHLAQMQREAELKKQGAAAMGFDQDATEHHFRLLSDGGSIEVSVRSKDDVTNRDLVRTHLAEIAKAFSRGAFDKPFQTHGEIPPGVPAMQRLKDRIRYTYEKTGSGGRVRIKTRDREALEAVHEFLRYQIREHKTGDPLG
jgi:hypothetical protein